MIGVLALFAAVAATAFVVYAPNIMLLAMAFVTPLERIGRFGDDLTLQTFSLMRIVGLAALLAVIAQMLLRRQPLVLSTPLALCALLQAQAFASITYALDPASTQAHAITMLGGLLMLFTIVQGVRSWRAVEATLLAWLVATLLICLYQVYDWHFGAEISDLDIGSVSARFSTTLNALSEKETLGAAKRAMGTTSNSAVYGINLLLALPFVFYRMRVARSWPAAGFWAVGLVLVVYNLMLTNTRAVLILAVLMFSLIAALGLYRMTAVRALSAILMGAMLLPLLPQSIWDRVLHLDAYDLENATNLQWRFNLWAAALKLGGEHWLAGVGVGNRTAIISYLDPLRFDGEWIMAHNEFLQIFTELGIPGLLVFMSFIGSLLLRSWRVMRQCNADPELSRMRWFAAASFCALLVAPVFGLQVDVFHFPLKGWWLVAGLILVLDRLMRERIAQGERQVPHAA
ncbi:hypothetical protein IP69_18430 [Bosea sp. AAP35]|nr:hypothetical protein IP69_18430 [Bosea sp. AAP35]